MIALALFVISTASAPGVMNSDCTKELVCQDGYTATVRPSVRFTNKLKKQQMAERKLSGDLAQYEEDHFIPLELCGCPTCSDNLWPQPWPEARKKDADETRLHRAVCRGEMTLPQAQDEIRRLWAGRW